jgi:hypothetical protein
LIIAFNDQLRWKLITGTMHQDGIDRAVWSLMEDLERTGFLQPVFR